MRVILAGGGIGGLTAALALVQAGIDVSVHEQADELRPVGAGISLWPNATRVLRQLGLLPDLRARSAVIERVHLLTPTGDVLTETTAPDGFDPPALCIHRAHLHAVLQSHLPPGVLHLGQRVERFEDHAGDVVATLSDETTVTGDVLVGCDGLHSVIRTQLFGQQPPVYRGYPVWRGMVPFPLNTPPGKATETWGRGRRFGFFRTDDEWVYWYATTNEPAGQPDAPEGTKAKLLRLFAGWHIPVEDLLHATDEAAILKHDTLDRPPLPRWTQGNVTLLGDAAHSMTPNMGQGACSAIEDAAVLAHCLKEAASIPAALQAYEQHRRPRTTGLVKQSLQIGRLGQWTHPWAVALRNSLMRAIPTRVNNRTQMRLFTYDLYTA